MASTIKPIPIQSIRPLAPKGRATAAIKNTARLAMTPTTAAVTAAKGAVSLRLPRVDSTQGPPAKIKTNDGKNVNQVATHAPSAAPKNRASGPITALPQLATKPTKATTMINGPGVVSPSARPSIICGVVSHW